MLKTNTVIPQSFDLLEFKTIECFSKLPNNG
jgi:hypothetical protein